MSGWLKNKFSTAAAIATGMGMQPVLFDSATGDLVVKVQVAGAANFQARGPDGPGLLASYNAQYGKTATSMAGHAGKTIAASGAAVGKTIAASGAAAGRYGSGVGRALAGYSGGRSRRNRRNRRDPTRRNRRN
jgi:hypothetical protein